MKDQILKIAGVKSEKEFYKKYPTEEAFMKAHGKAFKKAAMGTSMVKNQLEQLTDFGNPAQAQYGTAFKPLSFEDAMTNTEAMNFGMTKENYAANKNLSKVQPQQQDATPGGDGLSNFLSMATDVAGEFMSDGAEMKDGGYVVIPKAQFGAIAGALKNIGQGSGGMGNLLADTFGKKAGGAKGIMGAVGPKGLLGEGGAGLKSLGTKSGLGAAGKAAGLGILNAAPDILNGIGQMKQQKENIAKAQSAADITGVVDKATASNQVGVQKGKYVRPEDQLVQPGQLSQPGGVGTNFLQAQDGAAIGGNPTEIQNMYTPGTLYSDLGYEPLEESLKQYAYGGGVPQAGVGFSDLFQSSGQASIGKGVGSAIGNVFGGPLGGMIGGALGSVVGNLAGGAKDAQKLASLQSQRKRSMMQTAASQMSSGIRNQFGAFMEDGGYVSNDWQPQVITKFGEYNVKDLFKADPTMNTLRAGGSIGSGYYTPPSARALETAQQGAVLDSYIRSKTDLQSTDDNGRFTENLRHAISSTDTYADGRPVEKTNLYSITKGRGDNQRVKEFLKTQVGDAAPQYSMQKTYKPLFSDQYKTVSKNIGAGRGERRMADMENFLAEGKMENGGYMAMGGDLVVERGGDLEVLSSNDYLGDIVQFQGKDHEEYDGNGRTGIDINYGGKRVEVEGGGDGNHQNGEIGVKMNDGGSEENLTIYGNVIINKELADLLGDKKAVGKKFKGEAKDIALNDAKQTKTMAKASEIANSADMNYSIDQTKLNSALVMEQGAKMQKKINADKLQRLAMVQDGLLKTAEKLGVDPNDMFKAKFGKTLSKAQKGENISAESIGFRDPITHEFITDMGYNTLPDVVVNSSKKGFPKGDIIPRERNTSMGDSLGEYLRGLNKEAAATKKEKNTDWELLGKAFLSGLPFGRPTNQRPMDPSQIMPEQLALLNNQLEPVQAQTFQPLLQGAPADISLQDQLNEITAQSRVAERMMQNNPEAAATLFADVANAKTKVLGEQFRLNQARKEEVYNKNRQMLNEAQLQNLGIYDKQFERQSVAKSKTKAQALEAVKSAIAKEIQHNALNRKLSIMENMYGYRFTPEGQAYSINNPAQFNMYGSGKSTTGGLADGLEFTYDANQRIVGTRKSDSKRSSSVADALSMLEEEKNGGKVKKNNKNSSIVKAFKNL